MATKEEILDAIAEMSVLELSEMLTEFEEKFGVTAAAPVAVAAAAPAAGDGEAEEEQDAFDVVLTDSGDKKIQVIKAVREITSLGLADAKAMVEAAPKVIKEAVSKDEAEELKKKLEDAGAQVTIK